MSGACASSTTTSSRPRTRSTRARTSSATATGPSWTTSSGRSATRSASGSCTSTTRRRRGRSRTAGATTRGSLRRTRSSRRIRIDLATMPDRPPNVLLVMADQLVPFLTGAYGHPVVRTPALDRLAAEGIRFDAAYTPYPLCSPARASFMTGRYASRLGFYDNASILPADEPTAAHYLTSAGYDTALSGKMHFVGPDQLHGFRRRLTTDVFPGTMDWVPTIDEKGRFVRGGHARSYVTPEVGVRPWTKFLSYDEETHFRALEFLRERGRLEPDDPFFLVVSYHHPHDPFKVTQELWDLYEGAEIELPSVPDEIEWSAMDVWANAAPETDQVDLSDRDALTALRRSYYGLVTYVDRKLGELLAALEQTGQAGDTVVLFTSDHGDMLAERRMVEKRCFYEWSVRIPLLLRFSDGSRAGN